MATGQSGVCRRNRRIDQNDPALRPMPARRAPRTVDWGAFGPVRRSATDFRDLHRLRIDAVALGRRRATGDVTAHKSGGGPKPKLAAYDEALCARVSQRADITLVELQAWLAGDHAVKVSVGCLWARVRHLGLTLKKSRNAPQSRIVPT